MCMLTVLFPGELCTSVVERAGVETDPLHSLGHVQLAASDLLEWLHTDDEMKCQEQHGQVSVEAVITAENARLLARNVLDKLKIASDSNEATIKAAIERIGAVVLYRRQ